MTSRLRSLAKPAVLAVNTPLARSRAARAFASAGRPFKLEIGGLRPRQGWVVTNVGPTTRHFLDATSPWPLEDAALEYVFADNVIEHISLPAARVLFAEAYRCLRPGGVLRLVTPDIRAHVDLYRAGSASLTTEVAGFYREIGLTVEHPIDLLRIPIGSFGHHTGYVWDFASLAAELRAAGFAEPVQCTLGESEHTALRGLDLRDAEGGVQLAVEATR